MNTKPNRDITADTRIDCGGTRVPVALLITYIGNGWSNDEIVEAFPTLKGYWIEQVREAVTQALTKQKEEIVKSLRMEKSSTNRITTFFLSRDKVEGYNQAVDEFNNKLDKMK